MRYFQVTGAVGLIAVACAAGAWLCAIGNAHQPSDTMLFGTGMPVALFGILGYLFIALSAFAATLGWNPPGFQKTLEVVNHLAVAFATVFTVYLVWRSIDVELACPGCWICWGINVFLGVRLAKYLIFAKTVVS